MADTENVQGRTESDRLTPIQDPGTHAQLGIANCLKTPISGVGVDAHRWKTRSSPHDSPHARATDALEEAQAMTPGARRTEALKKAGLPRRTADNQGVISAKGGAPRN
jgi:hypothetical protein